MMADTTQNYKVPSTSKVSVDKLLRVGYYELEKTIGKGNFAVVKLASNIVTKSKVAIKIIDKTCLNEEYLAKTFREIAILKLLQHPHITRLYEVMESQTMLYLVTEYAANGEIFDHLVENGRMKESEAARVFAQLVSAVEYCHVKGVVHRDLKAENVLLDHDMNIKLADFGFSNRYKEGCPLTTWCGSPPYAAPEVFQGLEYDGPMADIWSMGVVLYALVCGALPFDGKTLLELKSRVVTGKFRIPFFMSQDCEHLIRNMLVVEPDRRYTLRHIIKHRWLSEWSANTATVNKHYAHSLNLSTASNSGEAVGNLDSVVMTHMLQLPGLTADMIAQSVHEKRFDNIYAIYNLLLDKLQQRRREQQRLQHANLAYSRLRKTSITTGVVDRSEPIKQETEDRLSPLSNANVSSSSLGFQWAGINMDLEKYSDLELECLARPLEPNVSDQNRLSANAAATNGQNTRRHTVGPGDVAHEQALANPNVPPIDFKYATDNNNEPATHYLPMNLPMLQNQPLHNLTMKDQHLLKPPTVMGATNAFGRRASDGGANFHIYYPSSVGNMPKPQVGQHFIAPVNLNDAQQQQQQLPEQHQQQQQQQQQQSQPQQRLSDPICITSPMCEESNDEIQRYMQMRGCIKRHTVGCTDDLSVVGEHAPSNESSAYEQPQALCGATAAVTLGGKTSNSTGAGGSIVCGSSGRTRRTGLLTVTERPPVISPELVREVESRMNRNYMPPALKLQQQQQTPQTQQQQTQLTSPSTCSLSTSPVYYPVNVNPTQSLGIGVPTVSPASICNTTNRRVYGKACKLPTVQEVGRYSPVRRASEGSKAQFQGPLQEYQYLQKGIAQRNLLVAPSPPLLENSISLPGSPIHSKPTQLMLRRGQDVEVSQDVLKMLIPALERLVKELRICVDTANKIVNTGLMPMNLAMYFGLVAHSSSNAMASAGHLAELSPTQQEQSLYNSVSVSPISLPHSSNNVAGSCSNNTTNNIGAHSKQMLGGQYHFTPPSAAPSSLAGQLSNIQLSAAGICSSRPSSSCQSPVYSSSSSFSGSSSPNAFINAAAGGSSPLHQITKGISVLTTSGSSVVAASGGGGGGSIMRGTSAAVEIAQSSSQQPLDLSMDVCIDNAESNFMQQTAQQQQLPSNWFMPATHNYYDMKPLNLSPAVTQQVRLAASPPATPNLCIIQEEHAQQTSNMPQLSYTISTGTPYAGCSAGVHNEDANSAHAQAPMYPQICLTDVQGSEITLVAVSSENSRDSDCDSLEPQLTPQVLSLQDLIITEPASDMPSITRGTARKTSLENEANATRLDAEVSTASAAAAANDANRRGSDKSLGFSDDSLSNDSNNLSPCQEPSASSGFKSDSHSDMGDHTEGRLTPDSISCDSRRMSDEMCYEVPLPMEWSTNLDSTRILEILKQTIDSTMPPKGFTLHKRSSVGAEEQIADLSMKFNSSSHEASMALAGAVVMEADTLTNLSLEYSGGLQIELQVCEGRGRSGDNQCTAKGIKLRRISGDQFEYGKLCQQLISTITMQQVAG